MTVPGNGARIILKLGKYTVPGPRANLVDLCTEKSVRSIETFASTSQLNIRMEGLNQGRGGDGFSKLQSRDHTPHESPLDDTDVRRIHVLGMGSIGLLVAHSLMRLEQSRPISLLLHRAELVDNFRLNRTTRLLNKHTDEVDVQSGYSFESLESESQEGVPNWRRFLAQKSQHPEEGPVTEERPIHSLIVACKAPATVSAIHSVKHRITRETTICLMQNGMGQVDELNQKVFTNPALRPEYILGIVSHGLYVSKPFTAVHAGVGKISIGVVRDLQQSTATTHQLKPSTEHLLNVLTRAPGLGCTTFDYAELLQLQFEKLVVNCVLNPLTALVDVRNGGMLNNDPLSHVQCALIAEISKVIQALPEMQGNEELSTRFGSERLTERFIYVTQLTAKNSSSMREDVRGKRDTEIEYINGYIVRRGKEVGIECVANALMMQLVQGKTIAGRKEHLP
jgi:2-dehydropantoate 2-reductase